VDVVGDPPAGAEDHGRLRPLPDAQHLGPALLGIEEQRLVQSEVLGERGERPIQKSYRGASAVHDISLRQNPFANAAAAGYL
jgi:hypothetical protein